MSVSDEQLYHIGLFLMGFAVLAIAVAVPVFIILRNKLKKRLEDDYGDDSLTL